MPMRSPEQDGDPFDLEPGAGTGEERRSSPRRQTDEPATIKILNPLTESERIDARVTEFSRQGLKMRLGQPLMPGTLVQIRIAGRLVMGEIRYCNASGDEYQAGVRLQDVFETGS